MADLIDRSNSWRHSGLYNPAKEQRLHSLHVSVAIPAVLLGAGFPLSAMKAIPILARTAGLLGHLAEELERPIGLKLAANASRELVYDGPMVDQD